MGTFNEAKASLHLALERYKAEYEYKRAEKDERVQGGREGGNPREERELLEIGARIVSGGEDKESVHSEPTNSPAQSNFNLALECFPVLLHQLSVHLDLSGFISQPCDTVENVLTRTTHILNFWNVSN